MRRAVPLLLLTLVGGPLRAQASREPFLPATHWTRTALQRLAGLDAIPSILAYRAWPLRRDEVRAAFVEAEAGDSIAARLARRDLRAFDLEFGSPARSSFSVAAEGGWMGDSGLLVGGTSARDASGSWRYPGPTPVAASHGAAARVAAELVLAARITAVFSTAPADGWSSDEAWLGAGLGPLDLWAGRRTLDFGRGAGALVLSGMMPFDGIGLRTARPWIPRGFLSFLGAVDASLLLSRFERSGVVDHPWFGAGRIVLSPSRGFTIGLNRAVLFGGDGNVQATSLRNLLFVAGGLTGQLGKDSGYENQVASIDLRAVTHGGGLPLVLHGEIAIDDVGFSMFRTAAFSVGIDIPALPGIDATGLGIEHTRIPASCCTQPPWYRHGDLGDGWTRAGALLGHPLGGQGTEWAMRFSVAGAAAHVEADLLVRTRGEENLLSPDHRGRSLGGTLQAVLPVRRYVVAEAATTLERGSAGWEAWQARLGFRFRLRAADAPHPDAVTDDDPRNGSRKEETDS